MNKVRSGIITSLSIFSLLSMAACSLPGGGSGPGGPTGPSITGSVQMWVTDAPRADNVSEIWVTVSDIKIHRAGSAVSSNDTSANTTGNTSEGLQDDTPVVAADWLTVNISGDNRFDLLTLRGDGNGGGLQQFLAGGDLAAGHYTQIKMTVAKVEVRINGVLKEATIPGGNLKFVRPFEIQAGNVTKLLFDFDADRFVTVTGNPADPDLLIRPVVKLTAYSPHRPDAGGTPGNQTNSTAANRTGVLNNPPGGPPVLREDL